MANDFPGFVSNRILMPFINEAVWALHDGVAEAEAIDTIARLGFAHPLGPLALADLIGLDTCVAIMEVLREGLGERALALPIAAKSCLRRQLGPSLGRVSSSISRRNPPSLGSDARRVFLRLLLVDDDDGVRALLRATFEAVDVQVEEAKDADSAEREIAAARPDAIVLDGSMPGRNGLALCAALKADPATHDIPVVLLSGSDLADDVIAEEVGADAFVLKPFSPLELLAVVERLAGGLYATPFRASRKREPDEQLLLYARDLRHLLELERGQRRLLQDAYHETVTALASALESRTPRRARTRSVTTTPPSWPARSPRDRRGPSVSTGSCSTTWARSGSRTRSSRSPAR